MFVDYYHESLCHLQKVNNDLLTKIIGDNHLCAFFVDRCVDSQYKSIDEFREKVPLTTYDDYRSYIDRMIHNGEKNLLCCEQVIYYATSSATTGQMKFLPISRKTTVETRKVTLVGSSVMWRSLPISRPSPEQRMFQLYNGKKPSMYHKSKDGTPIGPISQFISAVTSFSRLKYFISTYNVMSMNLIEEIADFETNTFVELVFALTIPDLFSYSVPFASVFLHTIKLIEQYNQQMINCILHADFNYSTIVRENIRDSQLLRKLNRTLNDIILEYGGSSYQLERVQSIRKECLRQDVEGLLHRLWPSLIYASTALGGSFTIYKQRIEFYCGQQLPLINLPMYASSEGFFGCLANIHTNEYFLSPTTAFFEFIREQDIHQTQPKTFLISEIEPGNRYELVVTTVTGLVRYRMGDVIHCTRFLNRTDDFISLPAQPIEVPRIPLITIDYRVGNLLNIIGEKTSEQQLMNALQQTIDQWNSQGFNVRLCDFTAFAKLDRSPAQYVIFLELTGEIDVLQHDIDSQVDRQLCITNGDYQNSRHDGELASLTCILVRTGTFATFINKKLVTDSVNPIQIKPHRLLKNEQHIQFFYDNQI